MSTTKASIVTSNDHEEGNDDGDRATVSVDAHGHAGIAGSGCVRGMSLRGSRSGSPHRTRCPQAALNPSQSGHRSAHVSLTLRCG